MSNQNLVPYVFGDEMVRVRQDENGDPWFVAKDVCRVLDIANHKDAVSRLDEDEKGGSVIPTPLGGEQRMLTVSESGLYALIFRSRKPEAKSFRKWVTSEVLPAIRKTGRYSAPQAEKPAPEEQGWEMEAQVAALKELAERVPLRASHRVQMMQLATRLARAEGRVREVDVLSRYLNLCETVTGRKEKGSGGVEDEQIRQFVKECCEDGGDGESAKFSDLRRAYCAWCKERGYTPRSVNWFGSQIGKCFKRFKSNVSRYSGVRLLS